jgi:hypothetical protein
VTNGSKSDKYAAIVGQRSDPLVAAQELDKYWGVRSIAARSPIGNRNQKSSYWLSLARLPESTRALYDALESK